jgi:hypothetical protein
LPLQQTFRQIKRAFTADLRLCFQSQTRAQ